MKLAARISSLDYLVSSLNKQSILVNYNCPKSKLLGETSFNKVKDDVHKLYLAEIKLPLFIGL